MQPTRAGCRAVQARSLLHGRLQRAFAQQLSLVAVILHWQVNCRINVNESPCAHFGTPAGPARLLVRAADGGAGAQPRFNVVITGATKGVGRALAQEFIRAGDSVALCSRAEDRVQAAVEELTAAAAEAGGSGRVVGQPVNVARPGEVAAFADYAAAGVSVLTLACASRRLRDGLLEWIAGSTSSRHPEHVANSCCCRVGLYRPVGEQRGQQRLLLWAADGAE